MKNINLLNQSQDFFYDEDESRYPPEAIEHSDGSTSSDDKEAEDPGHNREAPGQETAVGLLWTVTICTAATWHTQCHNTHTWTVNLNIFDNYCTSNKACPKFKSLRPLQTVQQEIQIQKALHCSYLSSIKSAFPKLKSETYDPVQPLLAQISCTKALVFILPQGCTIFTLVMVTNSTPWPLRASLWPWPDDPSMTRWGRVWPCRWPWRGAEDGGGWCGGLQESVSGRGLDVGRLWWVGVAAAGRVVTSAGIYT